MAGTRRWTAANVVLADGACQLPRTSAFTADLPSDVVQVYSHHYKNPAQLKPGPVLVVGVGNSGAEIALETNRTAKSSSPTARASAWRTSSGAPVHRGLPLAGHPGVGRDARYLARHLAATRAPQEAKEVQIGRRRKGKVLGEGRWSHLSSERATPTGAPHRRAAQAARYRRRIAGQRGTQFTPPLNSDELAFYNAVAFNEWAVEVQGEEKLAEIARQLVNVMRRDVRTDWYVRDDVRAKLRSSIKRLL